MPRYSSVPSQRTVLSALMHPQPEYFVLSRPHIVVFARRKTDGISSRPSCRWVQLIADLCKSTQGRRGFDDRCLLYFEFAGFGGERGFSSRERNIYSVLRCWVGC